MPTVSTGSAPTVCTPLMSARVAAGHAPTAHTPLERRKAGATHTSHRVSNSSHRWHELVSGMQIPVGAEVVGLPVAGAEVVGRPDGDIVGARDGRAVGGAVGESHLSPQPMVTV